MSQKCRVFLTRCFGHRLSMSTWLSMQAEFFTFGQLPRPNHLQPIHCTQFGRYGTHRKTATVVGKIMRNQWIYDLEVPVGTLFASKTT